jgi:hypothetical protein
MPEYPPVFVEEIDFPEAIEGVSTSRKGFAGSIRRSANAIARAAAAVVLGMLVGVVGSIAADKWRRRHRRPPP